MFILVTGDHHWWLGFINPRWSFAPNEKMPVELRFDGGPRLAMTATVPSRLIVLVPLPSDSRLIDRLGRSAELVLVAEGRSFFFQLSGTPAVTAELKTCVQKSLALQATAPTAPTTATAAALSTATTPAAGANAKLAPLETTPLQAAPPPALSPASTEPQAPKIPPPSAAAPPVADSSASAALDMPRPPVTALGAGVFAGAVDHRGGTARRRARSRGGQAGAGLLYDGAAAECASHRYRQAGGACQLHRRMALRRCCRRGQNHRAGSRCQRHRHRIRSDCRRPADVPRKFRLGASEH